jgi:lipopolysaccharide/colanic/teichoic acid biosynthesis glycosyltransferase
MVRTLVAEPLVARRIGGSGLIKRSIDIVVSGLLLLITLPLLLLIALAIRVTSPGPALFRQQRLGRQKEPFAILKFRSMHHECDDRLHRDYVTQMLTDDDASADDSSGLYKLTDDPRITRVGRGIRRTSLDELPQLINVLRGEMSLVGPRPVLAWEAELLGADYAPRFDVKPGITGLWQVKGRNRLTMRQAGELDVAYVQSQSMWLDLRILLITIPTVAWGAITGHGLR